MISFQRPASLFKPSKPPSRFCPPRAKSGLWTQKAISGSSKVNVRFIPGPELNAILTAQEDFLQLAVQEAVQSILEVELEECLRRRL